MDLIESVEDEFGYASIDVVSLADLYGGKICAALDGSIQEIFLTLSYYVNDKAYHKAFIEQYLKVLLRTC